MASFFALLQHFFHLDFLHAGNQRLTQLLVSVAVKIQYAANSSDDRYGCFFMSENLVKKRT
jgi:hypothetical protein